jgi:predicted Zn-dependent peptidase
VGDIDPDKTMALMEKYFGPIPAQKIPTRQITDEPPQAGERRLTLTLEAQPHVYIGYHMPQIGQDDTYALDVLSDLLTGPGGNSRTGRLYKSLVLEKKLALEAGGYSSSDLYPSLFLLTGTPAQGKSLDEVEKALYEEVEKLQKEPPTEEELTRVRNAVDASFLRSLRSNFRLANMLASAEHMAGDWRFILKDREKTKAVTAQDVQRVAKKYFSPDNRTVAQLRTKAPGSSEGEAGEGEEAH